MSKKKYIEIDGEKYEIPEWVGSCIIYEEYLRENLKFHQNEQRIHTFKNGSILKLPCPNLKKYCIANNVSESEMRLVNEKQKRWYKQKGIITALKRKAASADGQSYSRSVKETQLETYSPQILEWFGDFYSPTEVFKKLQEKNIKEIDYATILKFFRQNANKIRELRITVQEGYDDLKVGIKRSRLETLDFLLHDLKKDYDNAVGNSKLLYSKEMRGILDQARKEVEGEELKLTVNGRIDIQANIEISLKHTNQIQQLTIAQMVISRICNRMQGGLSYNQMVDRLAHSFYSQFNGFRKVSQLEETPIYPSSITYDILELQPAYESQKRIERERDVQQEQKDRSNLLLENDNANVLREGLKKFINQSRLEID